MRKCNWRVARERTRWVTPAHTARAHVHVSLEVSPDSDCLLDGGDVANMWGRLCFLFLFSSSIFFPAECRGHLVGGVLPSCACWYTHVVPPCAHCVAYRWRSVSAEVSPRSATLIDKGFLFPSLSLSFSFSLSHFFPPASYYHQGPSKASGGNISLGISKQCRPLMASLNMQWKEWATRAIIKRTPPLSKFAKRGELVRWRGEKNKTKKKKTDFILTTQISTCSPLRRRCARIHHSAAKMNQFEWNQFVPFRRDGPPAVNVPPEPRYFGANK